MTKLINFEGKDYEFPDDASDAEIGAALDNVNVSPSYATVIGKIPGEAKRQLASGVAGADFALSDLVGSETGRERALGAKREIAAERVEELPPNMSVVQEGVLQGGASALTQLPAMAVTGVAAPIFGLARMLSPVTTAMGLQTGFSKYGDERQAGFQPSRSAMHAMIEGLIEKYTEYLPLKELTTGNALWRQARNFLAKEFAGEQLATLGQDINAKLSDQPDMTLGDYFKDALVTAIATPVAGGAQLAIASAGQAVARGVQDATSAAPSPTPSPPSVPAPLPPEPSPVAVPPIAGAVPPLETVAAAPAPQPAEVPKTPTTVRVYLVGENANSFEATTEQYDALVVSPTPKYADLTFDQLTELQGKVPETERLAFDGTSRIPLPKDGSLVWKTAVAQGTAVPAKPVDANPPYVAGVDPVPAQTSVIPLPTDTIPLSIHGLRATALKFPDAGAKALWNYGAALTRYETTTKPADTAKLNALRDKAKEATGVTDDAEVADRAQRYVYGSLITGLREAKKGTYNAPTLEAALSAQKSHEEHIATGLASETKPGQVTMSKDLPYGDGWLKQMHTYLQAWIKTFSPQMRIVILGVQEGNKNRARTYYYGGVHYVYVPKEQQKVLALYVLAHEFGHMLVNQHLNDPKYAGIKDKLIQEYSELVAASQGQTGQEFVESFQSPIQYLGGEVERETAQEHIMRTGVQSITFDEWLADQFVRMAHTNQSVLTREESKGFWKPLFDQLKDFFDKIVKKFAPSQTYMSWVESLRFQDSQAATATLTAPPSPRVDKSVTNESYDQYEYTTRVLSRLPNKPTVKKVTIYGELGRADVRKQERELIGRILHDWPGESVDKQLFTERVLGEIVPLRLQVSGAYASYGIGNIGMPMNTISPDRVSPETHIWEAQGIEYESPHFQGHREIDTGRMIDSPTSYWAHARGFVNYEPIPHEPQFNIPLRRAVGWNIVELQSDLEQHDADTYGSAQARAELEAFIEDLEQALKLNMEIHDLFARGQTDEALQKTREAGKMVTSDIVDFDLLVIPSLTRSINSVDQKQLQETDGYLSANTTELQLKIAENKAKLPPETKEFPKNLPDKWWELILRHESTWAARAGYKRVRMASADTVAKVEGWLSGDNFLPGEHVVPALVDKVISTADFRSTDGQLAYSPEPRFDDQNRELVTPFTVRLTGRAELEPDEDFQLEAVAPNGAIGWTELQSTNVVEADGPGGLRELYEAFRPPQDASTREQLPKEVRSIYDRYAGDITKFVKREFNAKPVTDERGNTWLEWETNPALADMPVVYYNTVKAVGETGEKIAKGADVPELPSTFVRFQGFLQSVLQLNQMAKILPQVVGLQRYRTAMRSLHALKAKLFEGPNDRIHEWHKIGRIQAKRVEQALRDEQLVGQHFTALVQTEVEGKQVWVHIPTASFDKFMKDRGITKEGQELFLGVKNDYLSTLTAMEEVVRRHTQAFFEKNEIVLAQRMGRIDEEFKKLRETPYLPDMRFGNYSVQVRAGHPETVDGRDIKVGELVYWEKFESERGRNKRFQELKSSLKGHSVSASYDSDVVSQMRGLPQSVMEAVTEMLNSDPSTALTPEQTNALEQIAFDQTAAGKFAKYLGTPSKHIAGASKDMRRAYAAYHWKTANAIAKLNYFRALTGAMNAVRADARKVRSEGGTSDPFDKLAEYMQRNFNYVMNPQHEYEQLRAFVSLWYLWGSAKTAVMNMTSVPVLTFPYLWARFGNLQAQGALLRAIKDVTQYWRDPTKISSDRQRVLEQLKADGVTDQSFASMLASVSDGGVAFEKIIPSWEGAGTGQAVDVARRMAWRVTSLGMMPFRVVEQFNRQITGLAAYDLMVAKTGKTLSSGDVEAYNFARDTVDYTQNEYGAWNRPSMMQGKQSIFLLFFSFVQNMSFLMFGGDKSWWRAMMVLGALAGLQGLPGMDNLIDMFNWAARKLAGQHVDLRNEARAVAKELGLNPDMVMHGISHNWLGLGWDTSSSVGAGRIIPGTDAIFGIGKFENRFLHATSEIGGPVGSLMLSFLQALADDNPSELMRWDRALPPVLRNIEKTYIAATSDAWTNARGRPVADDPTVTELVGQSLGFSPTRRTERSEELRNVKGIVEFYKERRTNLMEMMWAAKRTHDTEVIKDVRSAIADFNSGVPSPHLRISSEDISASMKSREKLDLETAAMRSPQKRYRDIYRYIDELY